MTPDVELLQFLVAAGILHQLDDTTWVSQETTVSPTGLRRKLTAIVIRLPDQSIASVSFNVEVTGTEPRIQRNPHSGAVRSN